MRMRDFLSFCSAHGSALESSIAILLNQKILAVSLTAERIFIDKGRPWFT